VLIDPCGDGSDHIAPAAAAALADILLRGTADLLMQAEWS